MGRLVELIRLTGLLSFPPALPIQRLILLIGNAAVAMKSAAKESQYGAMQEKIREEQKKAHAMDFSRVEFGQILMQAHMPPEMVEATLDQTTNYLGELADENAHRTRVQLEADKTERATAASE